MLLSFHKCFQLSDNDLNQLIKSSNSEDRFQLIDYSKQVID